MLQAVIISQLQVISRVHASFWLGIEQCSNWQRNLVVDESGARYT